MLTRRLLRVVPLLAGFVLGAWSAPAGEGAAARDANGFAVPQAGARFVFPRDHGSHPSFRIEWWYVTGHLFEAGGARYGFQITFFRQASPPPKPGQEIVTSQQFASDQLFLAHVALLDVQTGRFLHQERVARRGWDAGASEERLELRNGSWSLRQDRSGADRFSLSGSINGEVRLALELTPGKPMVVFGVDGVSRKGPGATAASHYLTFPRLRAAGTVTLGGVPRAVTGSAWMDHEWSSSQLGDGQIGWDWAALQLDDGRELMVYRMRRADGAIDPYSTLNWVARDGSLTTAAASEFSFEVIRRWTSPATAAEYPIEVEIVTRDPESGGTRRLRLEPLAEHQELPGAIGGVPYWEGACRIRDERGQVVGSAYLELTGYAGDLASRL
jgi:predicted secreted hydrolase